MSSAFSTEQELTSAFVQSSVFKSDFNNPGWIRWQDFEVSGLFGIPDIVVAFGKRYPFGQKVIRTYAFELKLRNWKRALTQAYRYAAFAHCSFVVLDFTNIRPALQNLTMFENANIGLMSIDSRCNIINHYTPEYQKPYSIHLYSDFYSGLEKAIFENTYLQ